MNIDEMKFGELKKIAAMFSGQAEPHAFCGRRVLVRTYSAGVHTGVLQSLSGDEATLTQSVRLWKWRAKDGIALSGVAIHGIVRAESKLDTPLPLIALIGVIEVIPMSDAAWESIYGA